jgi:thioredoxin 2
MEQAVETIVRCANCGVKNRVPAERLIEGAKCGRCQAPLNKESQGAAEAYTLRCRQCRTRNRIPAARLQSGAKCGKCQAALPVDEVLKPQPLMITDANFEETVLNSPLPVLLFCWAPWCPSCGAVTPIIDEFARDTRGKVRVGKLNVDTSPAVASKFNILSVPYLFIFDNGELKESLPGGMQKYELMMKMAQYI